ncbi:MAG: BON domain-containing protein [Planctomycetaceae bacterium]|nr:BON domain-containing protein [Planctomycetales bacterium]MCB9874894.1 BON domain-containing protein [Planctomycetaceae bacterium]MCB9939161.1 BON domain-containing protein [Planctomycetaceae bacterium]
MKALLEQQTRDQSPQDLAHQAQERLRSQTLQSLRGISVVVVGRSVVLRGRVSSFYQKQIAQEIVKQLDGIESINNELEVCIVA